MSSPVRSPFVSSVTVALCFTVVTGLTLAAEPGADALARLKDRYPGVRAIRTGEGERALYGRRMGGGATVGKAAATWLREHFETLGDGRTELRASRETLVGRGPLAVLTYQQYIGGLPVEDAIARVVVVQGRANDVVYAGGRLARQPDGGFAPIATRADEVVAEVRRIPEYAGLTEFSPARLAVVVPEGDFAAQTPIRVWKFSGSSDGPADPAYTFFVDASTGRLVHVRDEIHHVDIAGHVAGRGTLGVHPDVPGNPPSLIDLSLLRVRADGGAVAETDASGAFVLGHAGSTSVNVEASLEGPWVAVTHTQGDNLLLSQLATPPGPVEFLFNEVPTQFTTSQVNGFVNTNLAHDFFKTRQPDFTGLDLQLDCNVNIANVCNAGFNPLQLSINFFAAGSGCVNTAYSSVIHHEYGHFIVNQFQLPQGAFGEGYGDSLALLINDDFVVGRDFLGSEAPVRDIVAANQQYPCSDEIHVCGQVLAGVWWDARLNLAAKLGPIAGLDYARQLFTDWTQITVGGRLRNSAHPLTAVEILTVDDDDANLGNGTPNQAEICEAFASHGIACPGACEGISSLRLRCRTGSGTIRASISTDAAAGSEFVLVLDETESETVSVSRLGRGAARFNGVSQGEHTVCVEGCAELCETVTCNP